MKKLLVTGLCLLSLSAFADHHKEGAGKTFEEKKANMLQHIDKKITHMNEMRSCVSGAADKDALNVCREKMKENWQDKKKERNEKRKKK